MHRSTSHPNQGTAQKWLLLCASACALSAQVGHAQSVWTGADSRDYAGTPPVFVGAFWSYIYVPPSSGSAGYPGNWSTIGYPGGAGGSTDAVIGAPSPTTCDVQVTLNALTLEPGGALDMAFSSSLTVADTALQADGTITQGLYSPSGGALPTYTNSGTLAKTGGTGTTAFNGNISLNSLPGTTIAADSGTLQLPGNSGTLDTVTFDPAAGAVINLVSQDTTAGTSSHFQGTLRNGAGTGTVLLSGGTMSGGSTPCTLAFTGSVFQWTGGIIGSYQQGATFTNTGVVHIVGDNAPTTYATFTNDGTVIETGAGEFDIGYYNSGGSFTNTARGVYDLTTDAGIGETGYPFTNAGLLKKSGGTGTSAFDPTMVFNNQNGTIEVDSGTLQLPGGVGVSTGGTFNVPAAGAVLNLVSANGTGIFTGTYTGSGAGTVQLSQGNFNSNSTTPAVLNFPGSLFQWTGGTIGAYQGGDLVTNTGVINIVADNTPTTLATFTNDGTMIETGTGEFEIGTSNSGGSLTNAATGVYDLASDAGIGQGFYSFTNVGLLKKSAGAGTSTFDPNMVFNNQNGTIEVDSGTLQLPGGGGTSTGGAFNVPNTAAVLDLVSANGGLDFTGAYTGNGAGTVRLSQGTLYTNNSTGATFNFPGNLFQWTGGTIGSYQGGHILNNQGTFNLSGDTDKVSYATITNTGTMIQTGTGNYYVGQGNGGGNFSNAHGGVYDLESDAGLAGDYSMTNAGLFEKTAGAGTSTIDETLTNTGGTISVSSGTLEFIENVNDISDTTLTDGSWDVSDAATLTFKNYPSLTVNQGNVTLSGPNSSFPALKDLTDNQGTLALQDLREFLATGDFTNEGTLALGAGSTLHVPGTFAQSRLDSALAITIGGAATKGAKSPGILQVTGKVKVAGHLDLSLATGFNVPSTAKITVLAAGAPIKGAFANVANGERLTTVDKLGSFQVNYGAASAEPDRVVLTDFIATPVKSKAPEVTIAATVPEIAAEGGKAGEITVRIPAAQPEALSIKYSVKGTAIAGADYVALSGTVKIKAGKTSALITITPRGDLDGASAKTVIVKLEAGSGYRVGTAAPAEVKIVAGK
jgi:hypothetical protein